MNVTQEQIDAMRSQYLADGGNDPLVLDALETPDRFNDKWAEIEGTMQQFYDTFTGWFQDTVIPVFSKIVDDLCHMFVTVAYEHPAVTHAGRRRSRREMRDIRGQGHKVYLMGDTVIKRE